MKNSLFIFLTFVCCVINSYAENVGDPHDSFVKTEIAEKNASILKQIDNMNIAVVAPSGYALDAKRCQKGIDTLHKRGFKVTNYYDANQHVERFAASDAHRLQQIKDAYHNPNVSIIMALRGGYGASRLLKNLDFQQMAKTGKIFVGYSDITVIHMGLLKYGAVSLAGPMVCSDYGVEVPSRYTMEHFEKILSHQENTIQWAAENNPDVDVSGVLWGGNLTMLAHLAGTPWLPDIKGGILFVEDVGEQPYRIERLLLQLDEAGILRRQKALVLGHFTNYRVTDVDNGYDFNTMLTWLRHRLTIPVITGLPFGHTKDKVTLPVGAKAHLQSHSDQVILHLSDYPIIKNESDSK